MRKQERKETAEKLRFLARQFERLEQECHPTNAAFTCLAIDRLFHGLSVVHGPVCTAYENTFGILRSKPDSIEHDLWNCEDVQSLRVLMLCFAAAMVETGDFYV